MADDPGKASHGVSAGGLLGGAAALATVIAAIVGTLNQLGYIGNHDVTRTAEVSAPAPLAAEPAFAPGSAVPHDPHAGTGKLTSLTGAWRDAVGGCHFITQTGSQLEVTNYFPESDTVMSHGAGTVAGTQIELRLMTMHGDFQISPDGRVLSGTMFRSLVPHPSVWQYMGTSCQKSG
jgi:hypothetical protein